MALVVGIVKGDGWLCGYDCRCQVAVCIVLKNVDSDTS